MSTPVTPASAPHQSAPHCPNCDAPLAADQRYCLNCGQRLAEPRVDFQQVLGLTPEPPVSAPRAGFWDQRAPLITFAGIAAIVIALGVGIVIGRGDGPTPVAAKPTVVTVTTGVPATAPAANTAPATPVTAIPVTDSWPASSSGWTVELSTLPTSAQQTDVTAAESAATSKGATAVGVLNGTQHGGTPTGTYVIYSGHYSTQKRAQAAKAKLKRSFPNAIVLHVTAPGAAAGGGSSGNASSQLSNLSKLSGSAASKASAKLPSTISTGGTPPPKDNRAPGGGSSGKCIGPC